MTPHQVDVDDGVVYLGLDHPGFRYLAPYYYELPYTAYNDWDHKARSDRRGLDNPRISMVWGASADRITGEIVFETATFDTLNRLKERIEGGGFLDAITNINRFQDQNSDAANVMLSERTTVPLSQHLDLPNANATWIHLEAHRLLQEPIRDPKFGTPFEAHNAVWTGMILIAYQRKIAQAVLKKFGSLLPEKMKLEHLTTTDETFRTGAQMCTSLRATPTDRRCFHTRRDDGMHDGNPSPRMQATWEGGSLGVEGCVAQS